MKALHWIYVKLCKCVCVCTVHVCNERLILSSVHHDVTMTLHFGVVLESRGC